MTTTVPTTLRAAEPTDAWDITAKDRQDDLGALPVWAGDLVEALTSTEDVTRQEWTLYTATAHERVMARSTATGHVYIANRGRGLTSLTAAEAHVLALFLLGPEAIREDGTEWGTAPTATPAYVRTYGCSHASEDDAYAYAERTTADTHVMTRQRYTVVSPWKVV